MMPATTIVSDAREILRSSPFADIRELHVDVVERRIILCGVVHSFYHKQLAQEQVRRLAIEHRHRIINRIDVMDVLTA